MALSDTAIRNAKPKDKQYKLHDEGGLFVIVRPTGGKLWRLKYRIHGTEQQLSLGVYPTVGLKEARERRDAAKKLLANGVDPRDDKKNKEVEKASAAEHTFGAIAAELIRKSEKEGAALATLAKLNWLAETLRPSIGNRPVAQITKAELLIALRAVEEKGQYETASRLRSFASRVFRYAIITDRGERNPADVLVGALVTPRAKHHAAILDPKALGALLRAIDGYEGHPITRLALMMLPHVFTRPGELRLSQWSEFDLEKAVWIVPSARMKMRVEHTVPLSRQVIGILEQLAIFRGKGAYVFPGVRTWQRPMSENTLNAALRRLGYSSDDMTSHGFRSTASTLLNESGLWSKDAIERALAHTDDNEVRGIYHRGKHWEERVRMAQWWSDHLDGLRRAK